MFDLIGPPEKGPAVRIVGKGVDVLIRVEDEIDGEIVSLAMAMAERRRFGKSK